MYLERCAFQEEEKKATMELKNLSLAYAKVQTQARADCEVLQQVKQIVAGKPFFCISLFFAARGSSSSPKYGDTQRLSRTSRGALQTPAATSVLKRFVPRRRRSRSFFSHHRT